MSMTLTEIQDLTGKLDDTPGKDTPRASAVTWPGKCQSRGASATVLKSACGIRGINTMAPFRTW